MFSLFNKFKQGFAKTRKRLFGSLGGLFGRKPISDETLEEIEEALYSADFGHATTEDILTAIKAAYRNNSALQGKEAAQIATTVLSEILEGSTGTLPSLENNTPQVICLLGVNGSGKTTTTAKLAKYFSEQKHSVLLGACDTFRAAANEQINLWADRLNLDIVSSQHGADAAAVAYDAYQAATARKKDYLLLDTAGRLHTKTHLMEELAKLKRVLKKVNPDAPHHAWLVLDGSLGSNSLEQARQFHEHFGLTGLVITKLDGTSRGGALVGIYRELQVPIYFIGLGEQADDLQPFTIKEYTQSLFDPDETS